MMNLGNFTSTPPADAVSHISLSHETHPNQGVTSGERQSANGLAGGPKKIHSAVCGFLLFSG